MTTRNASVRLTSLLAVALFALAGCAESRVTENSSFNDADLSFVEQMIPHHEQAVQISLLAEERAEEGEVQRIASEIIFFQTIELEELRGWLTDWGFDSSAESHDGHSEMSGMLSADELKSLQEASGAQFDLLFAELMIKHHEGAVASAQKVVQNGKSGDIRFFAESLIESQSAELEQLRLIVDRVRPDESD